jgi:hypothetical protein
MKFTFGFLFNFHFSFSEEGGQQNNSQTQYRKISTNFHENLSPSPPEGERTAPPGRVDQNLTDILSDVFVLVSTFTFHFRRRGGQHDIPQTHPQKKTQHHLQTNRKTDPRSTDP